MLSVIRRQTPCGLESDTKESENSTMIGVLSSETADGIRQLQIQLSAGKIPTSAKLVKIIGGRDVRSQRGYRTVGQ
jgi:hypothetical protein